MRTSIDLNDRLLTLAKQAAAKRGTTLREVFELALQAYLEPTKKSEGYQFRFGVSGGQPLPDVPLHDWSELRAYANALDDADYLRKSRK